MFGFNYLTDMSHLFLKTQASLNLSYQDVMLLNCPDVDTLYAPDPAFC